MPADTTNYQNKLFDIKGKVIRIEKEPKRAAKGGYLFRGLEVKSSGSDVGSFIMFPEFAGLEVYQFPLICSPGAHIVVHNALFNNKISSGASIYTLDPNSLPVLEPYRCVGVIEAVQAAICPRSADVRNRVGIDEPFYVAKGSLIHFLFENLLANAQDPQDYIFEEAFEKAAGKFATVLLGSAVNTDYDTLKDEARIHFSNLRNWLGNHKALLDHIESETEQVSTTCGLKGRADAILGKDSGRTILEIKTGHFTAREHKLQLYAYLMLFNHGDYPKGELFYTGIGKTEKLSEPDSETLRMIITGRNKAIAIRRSYISDLAIEFDECKKKGKCFQRVGCNALFSDNCGFAESSRDYYDYWFKLLSMECWILDGEVANIYDVDMLSNRIESGATAVANRVALFRAPDCVVSSPDHTAADDGLRVDRHENKLRYNLEIQLKDDSSEINSGEEIILHLGDASAQVALRCLVIRVDGKSLFALSKQSPMLDDYAQADLMCVDKVPFSRGPEIARHALYDFLTKADPKIIDLVVNGNMSSSGSTISSTQEESKTDKFKAIPTCVPTEATPGFKEFYHLDLNEQQARAVSRSVATTSPMLIHGPPGTGKTRVLAHIIKNRLENGERLLVVCPTNIALDRILIALVNLGCDDFLRVGAKSSVSDELLKAHKASTTSFLLNEMAANERDFDALRSRVSQCGLIAATAYQCASHPLFKKQKFDCAIVDEAGQLDEPSTLAPLSLAPVFILAGDHLQLPPVVKDKSTDTTTPGLERSLFERLNGELPDEHTCRLNIQYRMNKEIQDIPSKLFYDGRLTPADAVVARRLTFKYERKKSKFSRVLNPNFPVFFVDVQGADSGKARPAEAAVAAGIALDLIKFGVPAAEIGIITPYRAQQGLIRKHLAEAAMTELSVDTVDRFQGGEREVIILSLTRSDAVTSFLADKKRLNVSLSRARSKLILLGHGPILKENELFSSILGDVESLSISAD